MSSSQAPESQCLPNTAPKPFVNAESVQIVRVSDAIHLSYQNIDFPLKPSLNKIPALTNLP